MSRSAITVPLLRELCQIAALRGSAIGEQERNDLDRSIIGSLMSQLHRCSDHGHSSTHEISAAIESLGRLASKRYRAV